MEKMLRPDVEILDDDALIPTGAFIKPPPNVFTHRLKKTAPFYFYKADAASERDGDLDEGSKVNLLKYDNGKYCRVVNEQGLYVQVEYACLDSL